MRLLSALTFFTFLFVSLSSQAAVIIPKAPELDASAYMLVDATSGQVLIEHNVDERLAPASLTKMLTSYIAIHELDLGHVEESTPVPISVKAWRMGGSKMFVREGTEVPLIDLLRGIIVQSGNDASLAVAEYFSGAEEEFAALMNSFAERFGMHDSHFVNSTGWPADNHYSTARDMATLALHIVNDHPQYYPLYAEKYYEYNSIRQPNRNRLLWRDPSVDGLKTGHTDEAGYCLVASAKRDDTRFVAVVMGARSDESRARETQKLLSYGFRYFESRKIYQAEEVLSTAKVWLGKSESVNLSLDKDLFLTLPRGSKGELKVNIRTDEVLKAPIKKGQALGQITISHNGEVLADRPLLAQENVDEAGFFSRIWDHIKLFLVRLFA